MITVHKYEWPNGFLETFQAMMRKDAEILCAQVQRGRICIWARVDTTKALEPREFNICGTGHTAPAGKYVGTVQFYGGDVMIHIFETTK